MLQLKVSCTNNILCNYCYKATIYTFTQKYSSNGHDLSLNSGVLMSSQRSAVSVVICSVLFLMLIGCMHHITHWESCTTYAPH